MALNRSFSKGLSLKGAYTYSKAINMTDDDGWAGVSWNSDQVFERNRARAGYDQTHMFQMGFVYELPMGRNHRVANSGLASQILGGWQVSGILAAFTGRTFTVGSDSASLNAAANLQTADQIGEVRKLDNFGPGQHYYDPASFAPVSDPRFGTTGRNILTNPGVGNLDLSFLKNFAIGEKLNAQLRAEFFNIANSPQFGGVATNSSNTNFMQITSASGERLVRFGLRFSFYPIRN
jgi:hypothetical protein